jgi:hypothetical protein
MAPIKCSVLPVGHTLKIVQVCFYLLLHSQLSGNEEFAPFVQKLASDLTAAQVRNTVDDSGGKKSSTSICILEGELNGFILIV